MLGGGVPELLIVPKFIEVFSSALSTNSSAESKAVSYPPVLSFLKKCMYPEMPALRFHGQHDRNHSPEADQWDIRSVTTRVESESHGHRDCLTH